MSRHDLSDEQSDVRGPAFERPEAFDEDDLFDVDKDDLFEEDELEQVLDVEE